MLLLDCGISFKRVEKKLNFSTHLLSGVLITHEHLDHAKHIKNFIKNGIDIFINKETKEALKLDDHFRIKIIDELVPFKVGNFNILAFEGIHDAVRPLNFVVGINDYKILYATDTQYIPYKIDGLTHIMIECNYSNEIIESNLEQNEIEYFRVGRILNTHMSIETAIKYIEAIDRSKLEEIVMIHLSKGNASADKFKKMMQSKFGIKTTVAEGDY